MPKNILIRLGIAGLILWGLFQGGYSLYQSYQQKDIQKAFQKTLEQANARELDAAFATLKKIWKMPGISETQKSTAKLLEQMLELLQAAPDDQKILDSLNSIAEQSNILQKELLQKATQTAQRKYSQDLENQRDTLLKQLQQLNQQDSSKLSRAQMRNLSRQKFETLQKLANILKRIEKQPGQQSSGSPRVSNDAKEQQMWKEFLELNHLDESLLPKSQIPSYRARKKELLDQIKKLKNPSPQKTPKANRRKVLLLNRLSKLSAQLDKTRSPRKKRQIQNQIQKTIAELSGQMPSPSSPQKPENAAAAILVKDGKSAETPPNSSKIETEESKSQTPEKPIEETSNESTQPSSPIKEDTKISPPSPEKEETKIPEQTPQKPTPEPELSPEQKIQLQKLENEAQQDFAKGDFAKAISLYQQLQKLSPNSPNYLGMEALTQLRMKNIPLAKSIFQQFQQKYPGDPMIPLLSAELALFEHTQIPTNPLYEQVVNQKEMALALYRLGNAALRQGNPTQALQYYQRAQKAPDYEMLEESLKVNLFHNQGEAFLFLSRKEDAKASFQSAIQKNPDYTPSYIALGQLFYKEQDYSETNRLLTHATDKDPQNFFAWNLLALSFHKLGEPEKAKEAFLKAFTLQPKNAMVLYNLGTEEISLKNYPSAVSYLEQSLAIKSSDNTNAQLGIALVRSGKELPKAKQIFTEILKSHPDDISAQLGLIEIQDTQGNYEQALALTQTILDKTPNATDVLYKKASLLFKLEQYPKAIEAFQTLLSLDSSAENRLGLAHALLSGGKAQEALQQYQELLSTSRKPEYLEGQANALIKLKRFPQAKASLQEIVQNQQNYDGMKRIKQKISYINKLTGTS